MRTLLCVALAAIVTIAGIGAVCQSQSGTPITDYCAAYDVPHYYSFCIQR